MSNALVITPTIGNRTLVDTVLSVQSQTVDTEHLIVVDGPQYLDDVLQDLDKIDKSNINILTLPYNTGKDNFWGHRIIAGMSQLVNHDYIFLLDDDDWYSNNHIETMVDTMKSGKLHWAYALRKIWTFDQSKWIHDYCVSIGDTCNLVSDKTQVVATSSYGFTNDFFAETGHDWYGGHGADQRFYREVAKEYEYNCTNLYTVNYRLDWKNSEEDLALIKLASGAHEHCKHRPPIKLHQGLPIYNLSHRDSVLETAPATLEA